MKERIADFIRETAYKPMTAQELSVALGVPEKQHTALLKTLDEMESDGAVVRTRTDRYGAPDRMNLAVGRLQGHPRGFAFLIPDDPGAPDVFIGRENLGGAWHNDRVMARLVPPTRSGGRIEGEVIRILKRMTPRVVGTFEADKNSAWVKPDEQRLPDDILVPKGATNGAKSGEKVVVQIVRYPDARRTAEGRVIERIGMKGQVGVDIVSVIRKFNLPEQFPSKVLAEAEAIPEAIPPEVYAKRRDLRTLQMVTIDGEDAKDLDDAVSLERIGDSRWRLGVHIADVSYYVKEGSALEAEAFKRGTSVYLADRVVPMLPPKLSNNLCSLNPRVDRLALSCLMDINQDGRVESHEIVQSVINTDARMTYSQVNRILLDKDADLIREYSKLAPMFEEMHALMQVLKRRRTERGALDFDLPEAKVLLNEDGFPIAIQRQERAVSEMMIEEFMLAANETIAEHCHKREIPFMYRTHDEPDEDRVGGLRELLGLFGYDLRLPKGKIHPKLLQGVTDWSKSRKEEAFIGTVLLRTMRQAKYSDENTGHFGLAAEYYCHFTSPIRRYPDLVVHRILREMQSEGGITPKRAARLEKWMPEAARHASERERVAVEAERETVDLKKAEFMLDKVGEVFEGIVSGVTGFGFFVQLPSTVEGLVHVSTLNEDYYHFHEQYYALIGERTRRRFRLGDAVVVRCTKVDVETRSIDFTVDTATEVQTVAARSGAGRARAAKKAALAGTPPETPQKGGKGKGRKGDKEAAPTREESRAPLAAPITPAEAARPPASAAARPVAPEPEQRAQGAATQPERRNRPETPASERRPQSRVDMWGVPVKPARVPRGRDDDDPTVVSPYALNPPPRRERPPERSAKATAEAPFGPSAATADEAAGMPAVPAVGSPPADPAKTARRRRRAPRKGGAQKPKTEAKTPE